LPPPMVLRKCVGLVPPMELTKTTCLTPAASAASICSQQMVGRLAGGWGTRMVWLCVCVYAGGGGGG
jgi:hypothetical protein